MAKKKPTPRRRKITRTKPPARRSRATKHQRSKPRIVRRRARKISVRRISKARAPRKLTPARSKRAKHQRANRRAGQLRRHARSAGTISKQTRATRSTPADLTVASIGRKGADPLQVQVSAKFRLPPGHRPSANLVKQAIAYRIEHGHDAPGVTTSIVRWRNPGRKDPALRGWREGNQEDAWGTLGNALRAWATV